MYVYIKVFLHKNLHIIVSFVQKQLLLHSVLFEKVGLLDILNQLLWLNGCWENALLL